MRMILAALPLALALAACETMAGDPYDQDPYGPSGYPQPYPAPYPTPYPQPYPAPYPQPYPAPYPGPPMGVPSLAQTDWRVVAINGRPVPASGYYINFQPDRMVARFGCNSLGAGYSVQGDYLNASAVMATRMACPDMSFETQGSAVLGQPMRIGMPGPDRLMLSNAAGSIEAVRAY